MTLNATALAGSLASPTEFAKQLVGQELWEHQRELAECPARYRVVCAGRQVGKSRGTAIIALHRAYTKPGSLVLLISAGEVASVRLLEECASLALSSPMLAGAVLDDSKTQLVLSNGSRIISVPASAKQIRGWAVDLLIVDEAAFVDTEIWRAAEPSIIARPGSKVILLSSPWGNYEHFFRRLWKQGTDAPTLDVTSFHWPSSRSPYISQDDLDKIQAREPAHYFNREYLAEWTDDTGAYFTTAELDNAVADYEFAPLERDNGQTVAGGLDWGFSNDANAVVFLAAQADMELNTLAGRYSQRTVKPVYYIPHLEQHNRMQFSDFIDRLDELSQMFDIYRYISETNGIGIAPTQMLSSRMADNYGNGRMRTMVRGVTTDNRRKADAYGRLKVLLQQGRLVLPKHPDLLRQLHSLEYEQTTTGQMRISVPETAGHDDLADALMQAAAGIFINPSRAWTWQDGTGSGEILTTPGGTKIHKNPQAHSSVWLLGGKPE